jgi:1-acyl-sn-glycerol-3-phosphate acyltransferase
MSQVALVPETPLARWGRRFITIPTYLLLTVATLALLPALLLMAVMVDAVRRSRWALARAVSYLAFYLLCETLGLFASLLAWVASGVWAGGSHERYASWNLALQRAWSAALFRGAVFIYGLKLELEEEGASEAGPLLVLVRHVSVADTLLPAVLLSNRYGWKLRYVMKRELLWDPCLDVVGQRLPNVFVRRDSADTAAEIATIRELARGLGADEGVLIYPEGTRFTPQKRERVLARLAGSADPALLGRARALRHVLPPRLGGPMALLEECEGTDLLFVAHVGFEGIRSLGDLWSGRPIGRRVGARIWRIPAAAVPRDREACIDWLYEQWETIDAWIDRELKRTGATNPPGPGES